MVDALFYIKLRWKLLNANSAISTNLLHKAYQKEVGKMNECFSLSFKTTFVIIFAELVKLYTKIRKIFPQVIFPMGAFKSFGKIGGLEQIRYWPLDVS